MHYATYWTAKLLQLLNDIVLAVPAVDDDGEVVVAGEGEVSIEPFLLQGERGVRFQYRSRPVSPMPTTPGRRISSRIMGQSCWPTSAASLGWMPTEAKMPGFSLARSREPVLEAAVMPTAMIWETPMVERDRGGREGRREVAGRRGGRGYRRAVRGSGPGSGDSCFGNWGVFGARLSGSRAARAGRNPFKAITFPFLGCLTVLSTSC